MVKVEMPKVVGEYLTEMMKLELTKYLGRQLYERVAEGSPLGAEVPTKLAG
jgi:hypothetical protein